MLTFVCIFIVIACRKDPEVIGNGKESKPTPYSIKVPKGFPQPYIPADNPMTVEGVRLGKYLFYDSILSRDYKQSCGSCHLQKFAFSNGNVKFSTGQDGVSIGKRNAPALFNKAWEVEGVPPFGGFFWDGRAKSLEDQALQPLLNPSEMDLGDINIALDRLQKSSMYPAMFEKAFGSNIVVRENIAKAIAQFMRSIVSGTSLYDSIRPFLTNYPLKDQFTGSQIFLNDPRPDGSGARVPYALNGYSGIDCGHCHTPPLFTAEPGINPFLNNGFTASGDNGELITHIKVPSLRNIALTMPYMHDGQLQNIDSVLAHYDHGNTVKNSSHLSDEMFYKRYGKIQDMKLSKTEIIQVKAFLNSLTDYSLLTNPEYKNPFVK